jgi:hypothetical protein
MVDNNNDNNEPSKGNDADKVGKLSDGSLRLVEETDKDGNICYCVETVDGDELLYSSVSKAQAFSFCEGYRVADGKGDTKSHKPKTDNNNDSGDKSATPPAIDPSKVKRQRKVF